MVRVRMSPKTRSAAVMKLETEYSPMTARQLPGLKGTSSEPKVKMAASRRVMAMPPKTSVQRWRGRRLIEAPSRYAEIGGGGAMVQLRELRRGVVGKPQVSRLHNIGGVKASQGR
jgi:hypothetical protein